MSDAILTEEAERLALDIVKRIAMRGGTFTSDDVWHAIETSGDARLSILLLVDPRWMGALFKRGEAMGWIVRTNRVQTSKRRQCHGRPARVWASLIRRSRGRAARRE